MARHTSFETDFVLFLVDVDDDGDDVDSLVSEWDRESIFGVLTGERGNVGERGGVS